MEPISLGIMAASLAASIVGGVDRYKGAAEQTATQQQMIGVEQQENALRQQSAQLQQARMEKENLRNVQRARSLALAGAVTGGAQFGSGLQGGFGQIEGAGNVNELGLSQSGQIRDTMFGYDTRLSQLKIDYSQEGGLINQGQGLMDIGRTLSQSNAQLTALTKQGINALTPSPFPSSGFYGGR